MESIYFSVTYKGSFTCKISAPHSSDISHANMKQPTGIYNTLSDLTPRQGAGLMYIWSSEKSSCCLVQGSSKVGQTCSEVEAKAET